MKDEFIQKLSRDESPAVVVLGRPSVGHLAHRREVGERRAARRRVAPPLLLLLLLVEDVDERVEDVHVLDHLRERLQVELAAVSFRRRSKFGSFNEGDSVIRTQPLPAAPHPDTYDPEDYPAELGHHFRPLVYKLADAVADALAE